MRNARSLEARLELLEAHRVASRGYRAHRIIVDGEDHTAALKRYQQSGLQIGPDDWVIFRIVVDPVKEGHA